MAQMYLALGHLCRGRALVLDARVLASDFEAVEAAMIISRTEGLNPQENVQVLEIPLHFGRAHTCRQRPNTIAG